MATLSPLSPRQLVDAWEAGHDKAAPQQALVLLRNAGRFDGKELSDLTVGGRDAMLLELRARTFGPTLQVSGVCPSCGHTTHFSVDVAEIQASGRDLGEQRIHRLATREWTIEFRLPLVEDLDAAALAPGIDAARAVLLRRCVTRATGTGGDVDPALLPEAVVDALAEAIESWDPLVETALAVECGACGHQWHALLEIGRFFYAEIEDYVRRLLREVDELARRYGWREADILAMSSLRRHAYLAMTD